MTTMSDKDVSMNFLPLTHVFEKAWCYLCIHKGVQICINLRPADIQTQIIQIMDSTYPDSIQHQCLLQPCSFVNFLLYTCIYFLLILLVDGNQTEAGLDRDEQATYLYDYLVNTAKANIAKYKDGTITQKAK